MPAEWEPHAATWLAWPHHRADWPGKFPVVPYAFVEMIRLITLSEPVKLLVKDEKAREHASTLLQDVHVDLKQVEMIVHRSNRGWLRDCGPTFVRDANGKQAALRWKFNAWAKYKNYQLDATVAETAAKHAGLAITEPKHKGRHIVLEGGAIEVNGKGVMLTTEECLLSDEQCRNPGFTRTDYEEVFAQYFGIKQTIWLGRGIVGDDTHGHIDDLARFVAADTIVAVRERDKADANHEMLEDNWKRLKKARDAKGQPFNLAELPMPNPVYYDGQRLPASYANFYITNGSVIVPVFNDPADREALNVLAEAFPKRDVVGLYARDLVLGLGVIHCLTQQQIMPKS
jgi:agmatine deiminase